MSIADEYLKLVEMVGQRLAVPDVASVHVATIQGDPDKSSNYGALVLTDGTVGLTYTALDGALQALQDASLYTPLVGASPLQAARLFTGEAAWERSLGMAAINAISQFVFKRCSYDLPVSERTLTYLDLQRDDHVGMVGYFPTLVETIRALALPLTVVELDARLWCRVGSFEITPEAEKLQRCQKIVCTGTVLVNHTADAVLQHCTGAETVLVAGPTVGCLPDPLFARGVHLVGGCSVIDTVQFIEHWQTQQKWRKSTRRYTLDRRYPGCVALLSG